MAIARLATSRQCGRVLVAVLFLLVGCMVPDTTGIDSKSDASIDSSGGGSGGMAGTGGKAGHGGTGGSAGSGGAAGQSGMGGSAGQGGSAGRAGAAGQSGTAGQSGNAGQAGTAGQSGTAGQGGGSGQGGSAGSAGTSGAGGAAGAVGDAGCTNGAKQCVTGDRQICQNGQWVGKSCALEDWPNVASYSCSDGDCGIQACVQSYAHCSSLLTDGCEARLTSDARRCGSCANDCTVAAWAQVAQYMCTNGTCGIQQCAAGFANCDANDSNGCEKSFTARQVTTGSNQSCAVSSGAVLCWGDNGGGAPRYSNPTAVTPNVTLNVTEVTSGGYHSCARKTNGTVWCWGANGLGNLGDGTTTPSATVPVQAIAVGTGHTAAHVSAGNGFTCAVLEDATARCWGSNAFYELGDGTNNNAPAGVAVKNLTSVLQIGSGGLNSCALKTDGTVWCWGNNSHYQLGDGTTSSSNVPKQVAGLPSNVAALAVGGYHACAVAAGHLYCWGMNDHGQSGDGQPADASASGCTPTPLAITHAGTDVDAVTAGGSFTCVRKTGGTVWCWGGNDFGQLGNNSTTPSLVPVQVSSLTNVQQFAAGYSHACAVLADSSVWCWGNDGAGQLGDGNQSTYSSVPVRVTPGCP